MIRRVVIGAAWCVWYVAAAPVALAAWALAMVSDGLKDAERVESEP